jgi:hypothetical protein
MEPAKALDVVQVASDMIVSFLEVGALQGHAAEPLRQCSRGWRAAFSDGPSLWRELYLRRWGTAAPPTAAADVASPCWRERYVTRHRGEISPDDLMRPVKRKVPTGGADGVYKRPKRFERIPSAPAAPLSPFFAFMQRERAALPPPGGGGAAASAATKGGGKPVSVSAQLGEKWKALGAPGQEPFVRACEEAKAGFCAAKGEWLVARRRVAKVKQLGVLLQLVRTLGSWRAAKVKAWLRGEGGAWKTAQKYSAEGKIGAAALLSATKEASS